MAVLVAIGAQDFVLFLGFSTMINTSSSLEVYFNTNGFMMLAICSTVGALLFYMNAVFFANTGGARRGFFDYYARLISGGSKQFL